MPLYSPFPGFATTAQAQAQSSALVALSPANMAQRTSFNVNKNAVAQTGIATLTATKITFGTEGHDYGGYFDTALSRWTPPASPIRLSAFVQGNGFTASTLATLLLYKNGVVFARVNQTVTAAGTLETLGITACDVANGSDYYELYIYGTTAGSITVFGTVAETQFSGEVL